MLKLLDELNENGLISDAFVKYKPIFIIQKLQLRLSVKAVFIGIFGDKIGGFVNITLVKPCAACVEWVCRRSLSSVVEVGVAFKTEIRYITIFCCFIFVKFNGGVLRIAFDIVDKQIQNGVDKNADG